MTLKEEFETVMKYKSKRYSDEYIKQAWEDCHTLIEDWFLGVISVNNEFTVDDKINKFLEDSVVSYRGSDAEKEYIKNEMFEEMMFAAIEDNHSKIFS